MFSRAIEEKNNNQLHTMIHELCNEQPQQIIEIVYR